MTKAAYRPLVRHTASRRLKEAGIKTGLGGCLRKGLIGLDSDECLLPCLVANRASYFSEYRVVLGVLDRYLGLCILFKLLFRLVESVLKFAHLFHNLLIEILLRFKF
jgi:hypothetical protein